MNRWFHYKEQNRCAYNVNINKCCIPKVYKAIPKVSKDKVDRILCEVEFLISKPNSVHFICLFSD